LLVTFFNAVRTSRALLSFSPDPSILTSKHALN
jgi:hypothetical protein